MRASGLRLKAPPSAALALSCRASSAAPIARIPSSLSQRLPLQPPPLSHSVTSREVNAIPIDTRSRVLKATWLVGGPVPVGNDLLQTSSSVTHSSTKTEFADGSSGSVFSQTDAASLIGFFEARAPASTDHLLRRVDSKVVRGECSREALRTYSIGSEQTPLCFRCFVHAARTGRKHVSRHLVPQSDCTLASLCGSHLCDRFAHLMAWSAHNDGT